MTIHQLDDYAHRLFRAHGDKAEYEAAQKALKATDPKEAEDWRKVRSLIRQLRGPNQG